MHEIECEDTFNLEGKGTLDLNRTSTSEDTLDLNGILTSDENEDLNIESEAESDENENAGDDEHGCFLSAEEVANLQNKTWGDVYPGPHAGAVHSQGIPTTKEFENVLGGPSPNPFAPFNNQTDWELAKWAKLRGPGSTAFTELMGVTGVRLVSLLCICFTTDTKIVA